MSNARRKATPASGALPRVNMLPDGSKDLYIDQDRFGAQFAADVAPEEAALMAATQRPVRDAALTEASGPPAWRRLPSWFVYGTGDRNIPPAALGFMAKRADSKKTVVIDGASHVVMGIGGGQNPSSQTLQVRIFHNRLHQPF